MRFLARRRSLSNGGITAEEARIQSEKALREAKARWPVVRAVSNSLRSHREENHFSEMIEKTFRESR